MLVFHVFVQLFLVLDYRYCSQIYVNIEQECTVIEDSLSFEESRLKSPLLKYNVQNGTSTQNTVGLVLIILNTYIIYSTINVIFVFFLIT